MYGLKLNKEIIERCVTALKSTIELQQSSRQRLIGETQSICSTCDDACSALLERLVPVRKAYRAPMRLSGELISLAGDANIRRQFKPEGLCSEIDQLLADFENALSGLRYSVHMLSISEIRNILRSMGNYDSALYHQYDMFMNRIGHLGEEIPIATVEDRKILALQVRDAVSMLEADLKETIRAMRKAKDQIRDLM